VGRRLLDELIHSTERAGIWTLQAGIFPENAASLALHRTVGFREVGTYHRHGKLDGQWRDCVIVEKLLGAKSLETVIQIQSEYAKTSYAAFVAQAAKMGELHSNLAKAAFKPAELAIAKMQTGQFPFIPSAR